MSVSTSFALLNPFCYLYISLLYIAWIGLLERHIGCGPASSTIAIYQWKVQESSWMSQLVFCIHCNSGEVGANAREGIGLPLRARRWIEDLLSLCPLYQLATEGGVQIKHIPSNFKRSWLKVDLHTSNDLINKKNPSLKYPATWVFVNSWHSQLFKQEYPSLMFIFLQIKAF